MPLLINADRVPRWLLIAWVVLSAVFLLRLLASLCLLAHRKSGAVPAPSELARSVDAALLAHRSRRRAVVLCSSSIRAPVLAGLFRPAILIPERLLAELSTSELVAIALHEAAHVARRDDYALLAERLIQSAFPLHPIVWWILRQIGLEREMSCDVVAAETMGSPRSYAACLVRVMELCHDAWATPVAAGMVVGRSQFARRVDTLLAAGRQTSGRLGELRLLSIGAIFAAFACFAVLAPRAVAFSAVPTPPQAPQSESKQPSRSVPSPTASAQVPLNSSRPPDPQVRPKTPNPNPPLSVELVVDRSGSMRQNDDLVDSAINALTKSANPADEFLLVTFSDRVDVAGPFANDGARILQELHRSVPRGGTSLRDAILRAIGWSGARYLNRRLIVISDGNDNSSSVSAAQLREAVIPVKIPVFAITLAARLTYPRAASRWLEDLAARTQGREFVTSDPTNVAAIAEQLVQVTR